MLDLGEKDGGRGGGKDSEQYWRKAVLQLLRNLVDLVVLATGQISVPDLYRVAVSITSPITARRFSTPIPIRPPMNMPQI